MAEMQEMSFQNVVDTILKPEGIKVGGYPDDLFLDLTDEERERWQCNICFMVSRDPQHCDNKHNFCATCVFAWSMTYGANSDKCAVCRVKQQDYHSSKKLEAEMMHKYVKCPHTGCALRCPLRDFLQHSHGLEYKNAKDLSSIRRPRPMMNPSGLIFLPSLRTENSTEGNTGLRGGRNLLQDMMLVLHMEMELRRRAIERFHADSDAEERRRHYNEVIAIQSQMQEITTFLDILFRAPPTRPSAMRGTGMSRFPGSSSRELDNDSDSDSSSDSSDSDIVGDYRIAVRRRQQQQPYQTTRVTGNRVARQAGNQPSNQSASPASPPLMSTSVSILNLDSSPTPPTLQPHPPPPREQPSAAQSRTVGVSTAAAATASIPSSSAVTNNSSTSISVRRHVAAQLHASTVSSAATTAAASLSPAVATSTSAAVTSVPTTASALNAVIPHLPRPSSTYSTVVDQLPPISRTQVISSESQRQDVANERINEESTQPEVTIITTRPGTTTAPHRRPVPPANSGQSINTIRRHTTNRNPANASNTSNSASPTTGQRQPASRPAARGTTRVLNRPRQRNALNSSSTEATDSVPRTRRRSEIHDELLKNNF